MKIALYKDPLAGYEAVFEVSDYFEENHIRLSEVLDIEFERLDSSVLVKAEVEAIDKQIQTVQAAAHIKTSDLEQRKADLLALPDLQESENE